MIGIYGLRLVIHFVGKFVCFYLREEEYPTLKKFLNKVSKDLYYGQIIAISIEAYLEFLWMGYLALKYSGFKNNGDILSVLLGAALEIIALVLLPMSFFYMIA
jgi:hypothetical protein